MKKILGFKVRNRMNDLYLASGLSWTANGKIWATLGHLRSALSNDVNKKKIPPNWELIVVSELATINADLVLNNKKFQMKDVQDLVDNVLSDKKTTVEQSDNENEEE